MNNLELSYLADEMDEDSFDWEDVIRQEAANAEQHDAKDFKSKYLDFYDDIKTSPYDDW